MRSLGTPWFVALARALGAVGYAGWWFMSPRPSRTVIARVQQYMAPQTVISVRPALLSLGPLRPGGRQYLVNVTPTPFGPPRTDTVEVYKNRVRTVLEGRLRSSRTESRFGHDAKGEG
jgi:hypothetical protein